MVPARIHPPESALNRQKDCAAHAGKDGATSWAKLRFRAWHALGVGIGITIIIRTLGGMMNKIGWLAAVPFLAILIGTAFANSVEPLLFGMPFVLAWIVIWVVVAAAIMAFVFVSDSANAESEDGDQGAQR
jgi:preprotein translocase subunit SecG